MRPLTAQEKRKRVEAHDWVTTDFVSASATSKSKAFSWNGFDNVLEPHHKNLHLYEAAALPVMPAVLEGGTSCIFAFGHSE